MTDDNELCEICRAYWTLKDFIFSYHYDVINIHCIELRRNRQARKNKKINPKVTVF